MVNSFIYDSIPLDEVDRCGYFPPGRPFCALSKSNFIYNLSKATINSETLIIYFPGSFGCFHEGHLDVVRHAFRDACQETDNVVVVIAPAHSDYTVEKYGDSNFATNKFRYERILQYSESLKAMNVIIDLNPMLNFEVDHNFTDLLRFFVEQNLGDFNRLTRPPVIISGKDKDFSAIETHSTQVRAKYYPEAVSMSTSIDFAAESRVPKDLYLRVHTQAEFDLFVSYMAPFYRSIRPVFIGDERKRVEKLSQSTPCITICKDYADIVPYVKLSRQYETPLADGTHTLTTRFTSAIAPYQGHTVIDSDVFSGGTRRFIEGLGMRFVALMDLSNQEGVELLDIDDFKSEAFAYPYVDLSSRCSLPAFTRKEYDLLNKLKFELAHQARESQL